MSTKHDHLRALARLCRKFGGALIRLSQVEFDRLFDDRARARAASRYEAPFTSAHGVNWIRKIIYTVRDREEVGSIIHEMGHVFADRKPPFNTNEWEWFGWEIAVARSIGAAREWSKHNANYNTGDENGGDWGHLSTKERRGVVRDRLLYAKKIGVVSPDNAPRSARP